MWVERQALVNSLIDVKRSMPKIKQISTLCELHMIISNEKCSNPYRHRAATTGSTGFITILLRPPEGSAKTRLNTADRIGIYIDSMMLLLCYSSIVRQHTFASCNGFSTCRGRRFTHRGWRRSLSRAWNCSRQMFYIWRVCNGSLIRSKRPPKTYLESEA